MLAWLPLGLHGCSILRTRDQWAYIHDVPGVGGFLMFKLTTTRIRHECLPNRNGDQWIITNLSHLVLEFTKSSFDGAQLEMFIISLKQDDSDKHLLPICRS